MLLTYVESSFSGLQSKIRCYAGEGRNLCLNNGLPLHSTKGYLKIWEYGIKNTGVAMPVLHNPKGCFTSQFLTKRLPEIFHVAFSPQTPYPSKVQAAFSRKNTQLYKMTETNAGGNPAASNGFAALSRLKLFLLNARILPDNPGRSGRRPAVRHTRRQAARCRAYCPWCRLRRRRLRPLGAFWLQCLRLRRFVPA